jgi:hypothetical protein
MQVTITRSPAPNPNLSTELEIDDASTLQYMSTQSRAITVGHYKSKDCSLHVLESSNSGNIFKF